MQHFLQLDNITVSYGMVVALQPLSLTIDAGEFFCLLGPSGCGKTTTLGVIAGFTDVTGGKVTIEGDDVTELAPQRRQFGVVFQSYALFPHMTAAQNIGYGLRIRGQDKDKIERRVGELLELVHLDGKGDRYPRQMSGGEQQRVAIARALAIQPRLILLDEPLSNLDARLRDEMRTELKRIQRATGVTTIFVTHDQEEAFGIADRIAVLNKGRLEQVGTPAEIYWKPASRFVAGFIGQANMLNGMWDAERERFLVAGQEFQCSGQAFPSGPATLFLRPEEIQFGGSDLGANQLGGVVESVTALGSVLNVRIATPAGEFLVYRLSESHGTLSAGETLQMGWAATAGRIIPRDLQ